MREYGVDKIKGIGGIDISNDVEHYYKITEQDKVEKERKGRKTGKKGEGIKSDLPHELTRLVASHNAGNTNTYNEINDVVDKLRRSNNISVKDSKKIYKSLKFK